MCWDLMYYWTSEKKKKGLDQESKLRGLKYETKKWRNICFLKGDGDCMSLLTGQNNTVMVNDLTKKKKKVRNSLI